jgi:hypothetical protein
MPGLVDRCEVCDKQLNFGLPRCSFCHKTFCTSCSFRVGGCAFCGKECGHAFFFVGEEDVDEGETARSIVEE